MAAGGIGGSTEETVAPVELAMQAAEAGVRTVCDLRPAAELQDAFRRLTATSDTAALDAALEGLRDGVAAVAGQLRGIVRDYEFWGEFDCPHVGLFQANGAAVYPTYLRAAREGLQEADPEARLWNGGYGVQYSPEYMHALIDGAPESFDVANWHHYNIGEYWPRRHDGSLDIAVPVTHAATYTANRYRAMFGDVAQHMAQAGCTQPVAASEWGMPVVSDDAVGVARAVGLTSHVFADGVYGLGETDAECYLNAWLQAFDDCGMQVLVYHRVWDADLAERPDETHWGHYCGLLYSDGEPKTRIIAALKHWAQRGLTRPCALD
jgi:hypothetical protein